MGGYFSFPLFLLSNQLSYTPEVVSAVQAAYVLTFAAVAAASR